MSYEDEVTERNSDAIRLRRHGVGRGAGVNAGVAWGLGGAEGSGRGTTVGRHLGVG